mmetsp:Transcript_7440/g.17055  ORF Transcript_7440/g.17055 Transcript_7440/m.17055 type:complete len:371 (+) Transcript_7440:69-1181(+)
MCRAFLGAVLFLFFDSGTLWHAHGVALELRVTPGALHDRLVFAIDTSGPDSVHQESSESIRSSLAIKANGFWLQEISNPPSTGVIPIQRNICRNFNASYSIDGEVVAEAFLHDAPSGCLPDSRLYSAATAELPFPARGLPGSPKLFLSCNSDLSCRDRYALAEEILEQDGYGISKLNLPPGSVVVDIGAHTGMFAMAVAAVFPRVHVIACEPDPDNFKLLQRQLEINDHNLMGNVMPLNVGVTADGRSISMLRHGIGGHEVPKGDPRATSNDELFTMTLDSIMEIAGVQHIDVLKIDCEGCEYEVLPQLNTLPGVIIGELHGHFAKGEAELVKLKELWQAIGGPHVRPVCQLFPDTLCIFGPAQVIQWMR